MTRSPGESAHDPPRPLPGTHAVVIGLTVLLLLVRHVRETAPGEHPPAPVVVPRVSG